MSKSIKLKNDTYFDTSSIVHNKKILNDILNGLIKYKTVNGLSLGSGNYQLELPSNTLFIEPLVKSAGAQNSGGQILVVGTGYTYFTNNDSTGEYKGMWISCDWSGKIDISSYRHCGAIVTGFRIWYLDL